MYFDKLDFKLFDVTCLNKILYCIVQTLIISDTAFNPATFRSLLCLASSSINTQKYKSTCITVTQTLQLRLVSQFRALVTSWLLNSSSKISY